MQSSKDWDCDDFRRFDDLVISGWAQKKSQAQISAAWRWRKRRANRPSIPFDASPAPFRASRRAPASRWSSIVWQAPVLANGSGRDIVHGGEEPMLLNLMINT
jgi:hypothetical protein